MLRYRQTLLISLLLILWVPHVQGQAGAILAIGFDSLWENSHQSLVFGKTVINIAYSYDSTNSDKGGRLVLSKLSPKGNKVKSQKLYGEDNFNIHYAPSAQCAAKIDDHTFFLAGYRSQSNFRQGFIWVVDTNFNRLAEKRFDIMGKNNYFQNIIYQNNFIYAVGYYEFSKNSFQSYIAKIDPSTDSIVWVTPDTIIGFRPYSICISIDGGFIVAGEADMGYFLFYDAEGKYEKTISIDLDTEDKIDIPGKSINALRCIRFKEKQYLLYGQVHKPIG